MWFFSLYWNCFTETHQYYPWWWASYQVCDYETKSKKDFAIHMKDVHIPRVFWHWENIWRWLFHCAKNRTWGRSFVAGQLQRNFFFWKLNEEIACKMCECNLRVNTTLTGICPGCMKKIFSAINVLSLAVPLIILWITWKCKECPAEFNWRSDLSRHMKGVHSGIVYACLVCS